MSTRNTIFGSPALNVSPPRTAPLGSPLGNALVPQNFSAFNNANPTPSPLSTQTSVPFGSPGLVGSVSSVGFSSPIINGANGTGSFGANNGANNTGASAFGSGVSGITLDELVSRNLAGERPSVNVARSYGASPIQSDRQVEQSRRVVSGFDRSDRSGIDMFGSGVYGSPLNTAGPPGTIVEERSVVVDNSQNRPVTITQTVVTPIASTTNVINNLGSQAGVVGPRVGPPGLDQLQRLILNVRSGDTASASLSSLELRELLTLPVSPELGLYLDLALRKGVLDPNNLLVQAIARVTTKESLIPVALALRQGANPNTYVNVPNVGTVHILNYVYITQSVGNDRGVNSFDLPTVNAIVIMLMLSGARPVMPAFDANAGRVRSNTALPQNGRGRNGDYGPSALEWLIDQGYSTILPDIQDNYELVDPTFMSQIGILLDRYDLVLPPPDLQLAFMARSNGVIGRWFDQSVVDSASDVELLATLSGANLNELAVEYLNVEAFRRLIESGYVPDYNTVNLLLVRIRQYQAIRDRLSSQQLEEMLLEAVRFGVTLDRDQFAMLASLPFGRAYGDIILQEYTQPYWRKACRQAKSPTVRPLDPEKPLTPQGLQALQGSQGFQEIKGASVAPRLRRLAVSLGVDPSQNKGEICEALDRLASADPTRLRQAAIRRQQTRISANLANVSEYIGTPGNAGPPMLVCRNQTMLEANPYEYNDYDLAAYRDGSGAVWCFTRDMFENLLETGTNPYSLQTIPESFRLAVQNQLDMARRLGLLDTRPIRFTEAVDALSSKDRPDDPACASCVDESGRAVETLIQTAALYGVANDKIRGLTRLQMEQLLQVIGSEPLPLSALTTSHALVTFARQVQDILRRQPDLASMFFANLNSLSPLL
jgi:hypothetical protein